VKRLESAAVQAEMQSLARLDPVDRERFPGERLWRPFEMLIEATDERPAARRILFKAMGWMFLVVSFLSSGAFLTGYGDSADGRPTVKALSVGSVFLFSMVLTACFFTAAEDRPPAGNHTRWD